MEKSNYKEGFKFNAVNIKKKETPVVKNFLQYFSDEEDAGNPEIGKNKIINSEKIATQRDQINQVNTNMKKLQEYNRLKLVDEMSKNLLENPDLYDFDGSTENNPKSHISNQTEKNDYFDEYNEPKENYRKKHNSSFEKDHKPKYINAILAASEKRKIEQSINREKIEKKKRERETGEYGDKPKYITKAYEEKLNKNKKKEFEDLINEKKEEKNTVNSEYGMMGFYSNLLTKNVAFGGKSDETINKNKTETKVDDKKYNKKLKSLPVDKNNLADDNNMIMKEKNFPVVDLKTGSEKKLEEQQTNKDKKEELSNQPLDIEDYKKRYLERKRNRSDI
jgi:hypothetical protein